MAGFLVRKAGEGRDGSVPGGGGALLVQAEDEAAALLLAVDIFDVDITRVTVEPYDAPWGWKKP